MLGIAWFQIDWMVVLPIILGILLACIIILRIIRRLTRWNNSEVSHVAVSEYILGEDRIPLYEYRLPIDQTQVQNRPPNIPTLNTTNMPTLVFFPPNPTKNYWQHPVAVALALLGYRILLVSPKNILNWIQQGFWETKIQEIFAIPSITTVLAFDYSMPLLVNMSLSTRPEIRWIFSRPTWSWSGISSVWGLIPFTEPWVTRIFFSKFSHFNHITPNISIEEWGKEILSNSRHIAMVHPQRTWLNKKGIRDIRLLENILNLPSHRNFHFRSGGFGFYRQETVWIGVVARLLTHAW
jgi:hypothetical protein